MSSVDSISSRYSTPVDPDPARDSRWEKSANKLGGALDAAEQNLLKAFSFSDEKSQAFQDFAHSMGVSGKATLSGLQMMLQIRYDRAKRAFEMLSQILFGKNNTEQKVIEKIGQ